jgi:hypothetical protein
MARSQSCEVIPRRSLDPRLIVFVVLTKTAAKHSGFLLPRLYCKKVAKRCIPGAQRAIIVIHQDNRLNLEYSVLCGQRCIDTGTTTFTTTDEQPESDSHQPNLSITLHRSAILWVLSVPDFRILSPRPAIPSRFLRIPCGV